jgi:hypothetical protein
MTIIKDAMHRAGFDRKKFELRVVLKNFLLAGGTYEDVIGILDELRSEGHRTAVQQDQNAIAPAPPPLPREDHGSRAVLGHEPAVDARQPITGEGQISIVQQNHVVDASAGALVPGADQLGGVQQDQVHVVGAGTPLPGEGRSTVVGDDHRSSADTRKPITGGVATPGAPAKASIPPPPAREPDEAYKRAVARSRAETAKVQLELRKTSNGTPWGSVKPYEFVGMERDGHIAWAIRETFGPFSPKQEQMELRQFLPDEIFKRALTLAEIDHVR